MKIKINLKEFRKKKGLTQKELASSLNVSQTVVSDYECGRLVPSLERAIQMAIMLDLTLDEFLNFEKIHDEYSKELKAMTEKKVLTQGSMK